MDDIAKRFNRATEQHDEMEVAITKLIDAGQKLCNEIAEKGAAGVLPTKAEIDFLMANTMVMLASVMRQAKGGE